MREGTISVVAKGEEEEETKGIDDVMQSSVKPSDSEEYLSNVSHHDSLCKKCVFLYVFIF